MRARNEGYSLMELLVATVVMAIVLMFVTEIFTEQHQTYTMIDEVSEASQNGRALEQLIERDLRNAGYMVPHGAAVCGRDSNTDPDTLFVSATDAILPVDELPLELRNEELGAPVNGVTTGWSRSAGSQSITLAQLYADTAAGGSDFFENAGVIITDRNDPNGDVGCGKITDITGNTVTFELVSDFGPVGSDADVVAVPAHLYELSGTSLLRDGSLVARGVEDLQVAYYYDLDDDQQLDGDEFLSDGGAANYSPGAALIDGVTLREVRFSLVVATRVDPNTDYHSGRRQATENRTDASTAGADGRRRRIHSATVRMRNGVS